MPRKITMQGVIVAGIVLTAFVAAMLLVTTDDSMAADAERGRLLYENHCTVCHTSVVHVRERRRATSRDDIRMWILRWQTQLDLNWGNVEVDDVTEFLNARYYGFKSAS